MTPSRDDTPTRDPTPTRDDRPREGEGIAEQLDTLDRGIAGFMRRWGVLALRLSLAVIFIWFGILKPLGLSPAAPLVLATVDWMPVLSGEAWLHLIGWWEVAIGVTFLFHRTVRVAIALLALQMVGTLMPLALLPEVTFQAGRFPYAPTMEGQYIVKNLLIISAALVVGGTVREEGGLAAGRGARPGARTADRGRACEPGTDAEDAT